MSVACDGSSNTELAVEELTSSKLNETTTFVVSFTVDPLLIETTVGVAYKAAASTPEPESNS